MWNTRQSSVVKFCRWISSEHHSNLLFLVTMSPFLINNHFEFSGSTEPKPQTECTRPRLGHSPARWQRHVEPFNILFCLLAGRPQQQEAGQLPGRGRGTRRRRLRARGRRRWRGHHHQRDSFGHRYHEAAHDGPRWRLHQHQDHEAVPSPEASGHPEDVVPAGERAGNWKLDWALCSLNIIWMTTSGSNPTMTLHRSQIKEEVLPLKMGILNRVVRKNRTRVLDHPGAPLKASSSKESIGYLSPPTFICAIIFIPRPYISIRRVEWLYYYYINYEESVYH